MAAYSKLDTGAIDSTESVFQLVRGIVPYINACISKIETTKPAEDCKGAALQQFYAYKKGLIEAYKDVRDKVTKSGFPGTGGVIDHGKVI